jgi:hypothetical protein
LFLIAVDVNPIVGGRGITNKKKDGPTMEGLFCSALSEGFY